MCDGADGCLDCAGVAHGGSYSDRCGACDGNSTNDCRPDCTGVWGGGGRLDLCGVCAPGYVPNASALGALHCVACVDEIGTDGLVCKPCLAPLRPTVRGCPPSMVAALGLGRPMSDMYARIV